MPMIDPKSLRIGNYVDINGPVKIVGFSPFGHSTRCDEPEGCIIHFDSVDGKHIGWECDSTDCDPIPLSEQELIRLGWTKHNQEYHAYFFSKTWGSNGVEIITYNEHYQKLMYQLGKFRETSKIEFVHQLQNLFYAITEEELTYKAEN